MFCLSALYFLTTIKTELPFFAHLSVLYQAKRYNKCKNNNKKKEKKSDIYSQSAYAKYVSPHIFLSYKSWGSCPKCST
jgi:hypothetical protein